MQDEMTQLRSENEAYKAKLDKQQSEIDALKAAVDQLLAPKHNLGAYIIYIFVYLYV